MNKETQGIGLNVSVVIEDFPISFDVAYDSTTLSMDVKSCKLDLVKTTNERFNNLNVVLPEGASPLTIAKFKGSVAKTDKQRQTKPDGDYRLFRFDGEIENIEIPIPIVSDIRIDKAFFSYQYLSAASTGTNNDFKDQIIFLGCKLSVKKSSKLDLYLTGATLTGAYFLSNNATIIYFDFSGTINLGKIVDALFGFPATNFEMNVSSAGLFRIAKSNKSKEQGGASSKNAGLSYLEALKQIANLQGSPTGKPENTSVTSLMPPSFPLGEDIKTVDNLSTSKIGIKHNKQIDTDFTEQFEKAFASDDMTGICFWAMVDFNNAPLFGSLNTLGYQNKEVDSLVLYGFNTQSGKDKTKISSTYFFAQLPGITLFDFLTLGGTQGRKGILFKYSSNKNEFELNGSIGFHALDKDFLFEGDLLVNDTHLKAVLDVKMGAQSSIDAPLGMTGIKFGELYFSIDNTFAKKDPIVPSKLNLVIGGLIQFQLSHCKIQLCGNIVFEKSETRLVLVAIEASKALLLSDFVTEVVGLDWDWLDAITRQIGFITGSMYYLSPPENEKKNSLYTFSYDNPIKEKSSATTNDKPIKYKRITAYKPGYHIHADLLLFESYVFAIDLCVVKEGIELSGKFTGTYEKKGEDDYTITENSTIKAFFISFESPSLNICTINKSKFFIEIDNIKIFNTKLGNVTVGYDNGIFSGSFQRDTMGFGFDWQWTTKKGSSGGFSIKKIDGIEGKDIDAIEKFKKILNDLNKGGCGAVTSSMFKDLKSNFAPALQKDKSPVDNGDGTMNVPLAIIYTLSMGKKAFLTDQINMDLDVIIPKSASELPEALFNTIFNNLSNIVTSMLKSEAVYIAIAVAVLKKSGLSLASKMLCRKVKTKSGFKLAKAIEDVLKVGVVAEDVGIFFEMEGMLYVMGYIGVAVAAIALIAMIYKAWDSSNHSFKSEEDKKKAQEKLNSIKDSIMDRMQTIQTQLEKAMASIKIERLDVSINQDGQYQLEWSFPNNQELGENETLSYQLVFLSGPIGETTSPISPIPAIDFEMMKDTIKKFDWAEMRQLDPDFQLNASIQTAIIGSQYLGESAESIKNTIDKLQEAINLLDEIGDQLEGAVELNSRMKKFNNDMNEYIIHGIRSNIIFATINNQFTIGQSALGINTKI